MKILITGANGQVAFELQRYVNLKKFKIFALAKDQFDITNAQQMSAVFAQIYPDIVINTAAYTQVDKAESAIETAFAANKEGAKKLAILCSKYNCPLIHLSTDYVFNGEKNTPYLETDPVDPINIYGASKWEGEEEIRNHAEQHLIIRVSAVFGVHGQNFVKTILRLTQEKKHLKIVNDQITCPTPAQDIAKTLWQLCEKIPKLPAWGTYHYCASPATSWFDFTRCFASLIEPIPSSEYPTAAKRPCYSVLDCQKIKKIFNIQQPAWQIGLHNVIEELSMP